MTAWVTLLLLCLTKISFPWFIVIDFYKSFLFMWQTVSRWIKQSFQQAAKTFNTSIFLSNVIKNLKRTLKPRTISCLSFLLALVHIHICAFLSGKQAKGRWNEISSGWESHTDSKSYPAMRVIKGDRPRLISIYIVHRHISGRGWLRLNIISNKSSSVHYKESEALHTGLRHHFLMKWSGAYSIILVSKAQRIPFSRLSHA